MPHVPPVPGDLEYETVFREKIIPAITGFKPDCILVSAGFDAHREDPLGHVCLSTGFFGWMTDRVMELANRYCNDRVISVLEGGYNLQTLPLCIETHLFSLSGKPE